MSSNQTNFPVSELVAYVPCSILIKKFSDHLNDDDHAVCVEKYRVITASTLMLLPHVPCHFVMPAIQVPGCELHLHKPGMLCCVFVVSQQKLSSSEYKNPSPRQNRDKEMAWECIPVST